MRRTLNQIPAININEESLCDRCTAKCCGYITQQIDTPKSIRDFDVLLWQIAHRDIHIFKDDNGWYILSSTPCEFLLPNHQCGIYETRPLICREHDTDSCEYEVPIDEGCSLYFETYQQLDNYCRERYKTWDIRFKIKKTGASKSKQ